ncbi:hypothetical protein BGY98DRAFT_1007893 [Russula aff. rugulosa BPL654]|nr:hypothetical protein BGY98DRAFT_1007893 [Russula aff. rugulosa BPL654]
MVRGAENYVPPEVVKIVVGNKLDKEYSRQVPTSEGAAFAARTGCLFVEASPRRRGVTEAFNEDDRRANTPPLVDRAVPQPRVCRGISICLRVFVLAVRRLFF